jgi:fatty acid desaturase
MDTRINARDLFSVDEIRRLSRRSDVLGWWAIGSTWAAIAVTLAGLARWPNPLTFVLAVIVLGGRQLALAITMHEAAHRSLFQSQVLNDVAADWLCARPIWNDISRYRKHHLRHHAFTGTEGDPDRSLSDPFPITRGSLARKLTRDLLGVSGVKRVVALALMDLEVLEYTVAADAVRRPPGGRRAVDYARAAVKNAAGFVLTNVALAGLLAAVGHPWLYSAWVVAYLTTFGLFARIRSLSEHACTERSLDPLLNTRSTRAGIVARTTVAPMRVNYHVEHHLLPGVPYFRLPEMQRMLQGRTASAPTPGYMAVLRTVTRGA